MALLGFISAVRQAFKPWTKLVNALKELDCYDDSATYPPPPLYDAKAIVEKCKELSLHPKTMRTRLASKSCLEVYNNTRTIGFGVICYGNGRYTWRLYMPYSEENLRSFLQTVPKLASPSESTSGIKWAGRARRGSLKDILSASKREAHPATKNTVSINLVTRIVGFSKTASGGDYDVYGTYDIVKLGQDSYAWIAYGELIR